MSARKTNVPAIPAPGTVSVDKVLSAIKEATEVGYGRRGDPLDRFVTVRELGDSGIARVSTGKAGASIAAPADSSGSGGGGTSGGTVSNPGDPDFGNTDYTIPPAPTNVQAHGIAPGTPGSQFGATGGIMLTWDPPNYSNHWYAEVYAVLDTTNSGGAAVTYSQFATLSGSFNFTKLEGAGNLNAYFVGSSTGTNFMHSGITNIGHPGTTDTLDAALNPSGFYYFVRFVSTAKVPGPFQTQTGAGAHGVLTIDPGSVLDAMTTNIRATQVYANLRNYIGTNQAYIDAIKSAGGVGNYVINGDLSTLNTSKQYTDGVVGTSPDGSSAFAYITSVKAVVDQDHSSLGSITTWQAQLENSVPSGVDSGGGSVVTAPVYQWKRDANYLSLTLSPVTPADLAIQTGDTVFLSGPVGGLNAQGGFGTIFGTNMVVASVATVDASTVVVNINAQAAPNLTQGTIFFASNAVLTDNSRTSGSNDPLVTALAGVMNLVYVDVTPQTALGKYVTDVSAALGSGFSAQTQTVSQAVANLGTSLDNIWSVRMNQTIGGLHYASGFGLGLHTDVSGNTVSGSTSTFIVNANQFAIMGPSTPGVSVTKYVASGSTATFTLGTDSDTVLKMFSVYPADGKSAPANSQIVLSIPVDPVLDPNDAALLVLDGYCGNITAIVSNTVTVALDTTQTVVPGDPNGTHPTAWPAIANKYTWTYAGTDVSLSPVILAGQTSIPFIVDTQRNAIGIRGKLIVDGLLRATTGDFDTLTANTAYIQALQAQVVNAQVVIGQQIIAGTPGSGQITGDQYSAISNYIMEMNNPVMWGPVPDDQKYVMRYWKPSTGQMSFGLATTGNMFVGGYLAVQKGAVIATNPAQGFGNLTSIGGAGADGSYAMWIGPGSAYGTKGELRTWDNGLFWVSDDGRGAGFNTKLFLGDSGLMLPGLSGNNQSGATYSPAISADNPRAQTLTQNVVSSSTVTIPAMKSGGLAKVLIIVSGNIATQGGADRKAFQMKATLIGGVDAATYDSVQGTTICEHVYDDIPMECMPFTMMGVVRVPASSAYRVALNIKSKHVDSNDAGDFSVMQGWNVIAMQVQ